MRRSEAYHVLRIDPDASVDDVKAMYRRLVKETHPDAVPNLGDGREFTRVVEAYRVIAREFPAGDDRDAAGAPADAAPHARRASAGPPSHGGSGTRRRGGQEGRSGTETSPGSGSARDLFSWGHRAVHAPSAAERLRAVEHLSRSGRRSAAVFLGAALHDGDAAVRESAAVGLAGVPGRQAETMLLDAFDGLTVRQRRLIIEAARRGNRPMTRLAAYAAADPDRLVREQAREMLK